MKMNNAIAANELTKLPPELADLFYEICFVDMVAEKRRSLLKQYSDGLLGHFAPKEQTNRILERTKQQIEAGRWK